MTMPRSAEGKPPPAGDRRGRRTVWMLSFESSHVAQAGGLGPAVTNLARGMAKRSDVSLFMPGHGRHNDPTIRKRLGLKEVVGFVGSGARRGTDGNPYPYRIGLEEGGIEGIRYVLAKGLDQATSRWLDERQVYGDDLTYEKMSLFSRAMKAYAEFILKGDVKPPDIIHAHDWNVVPAAVALRQAFMEEQVRIPLVYTIHLLGYKGFPWHYVSEDWCGIRDEAQDLHLDGGLRRSTYRQAWDELAGGKIERFGAIEADLLTTVSRSYLDSDVLPFVGAGVSSKSGFIYNGCDWDERAIVLGLLKEEGQTASTAAKGRPGRAELRRYLLTEALGHTAIPEFERHRTWGGTPVPKLEPFRDDGELVIATGRLDRQKGVEVLLRAVPEVLGAIPSAKFILMMIPQPHGELIEWSIGEAAKYRENVRLILGQAPIYKLAHVSADVYAMPSRWEPFGMTALEAMATGNPVVGSRVGGITETVLDIISSGGKGTGILVDKDDHIDLARGLISMLATMKISTSGESAHLLDLIPHEEVRERVALDPSFGTTLRANCRTRVKKNFGLDNAARMANEAYGRALGISKEA